MWVVVIIIVIVVECYRVWSMAMLTAQKVIAKWVRKIDVIDVSTDSILILNAFDGAQKCAN